MLMASYKFPSSQISNGALKETVLCGLLQFFAFVAVGFRLWARRMKRKSLQFNDYAILAALFLDACLLAIAITSTVWSGKGFHMQEINPAYRSRVFVAFTAGQPVWGAANTAVKLSILHLYLVIFEDLRFRRICFVAIALSLAYFVSVLVETFTICQPVQYNWDKTISGTCHPHALEMYLGAGVINLLVDVFIVVLPLPMLWRLRMPKVKKIGLIAMFSLGAIICVVSMLRVVYIARMDLHDFSYSYADLGMWSIVEPQLGVINACLPVMRPLLRRFWKSGQLEDDPKPSLPRPAQPGYPVIADSVEKIYPLDTLHLVGSSERNESMDTDVERGG